MLNVLLYSSVPQPTVTTGDATPTPSGGGGAPTTTVPDAPSTTGPGAPSTTGMYSLQTI